MDQQRWIGTASHACKSSGSGVSKTEEKFGISNEGVDITQGEESAAATKTWTSNSSNSSDERPTKSSSDPDYHPDNISQPANSDVEIHESMATKKPCELISHGQDHEVDIVGYRCCICNEDVETAEALTLHKNDHHSQQTLRRNPKRSKKLIDPDHMKEEGVAIVVQASSKAEKSSLMSKQHAMSCSECGKWFMTWKALFGHMRCHPERTWRGIQPPNKDSKSVINPTPVAVPGDLKGKALALSDQLFVSPPVAAPIQAQNQEYSRRKMDNDTDTESIEDGNRNIMGHGASWFTRKRSVRHHHPTARRLHYDQSGAKDSIAKTLDIVNDLPHKKTKTSMVEAQAGNRCTDDNKHGGGFDVAKWMSPTYWTFKCVTCKKQFNSHQALGGHRASSKKMNGCSQINAKRGEASLEQEKTSSCSPTINDDQKKTVSVIIPHHECSTCHRVFKSGQALGGHKRCHWNGGVINRRQWISKPEISIGSPSNTTTITPNFRILVQGAQTGLQRQPLIKGLQLDLNLPAPECVKEEMAQHDLEML